jgi:hypothetical protein
MAAMLPRGAHGSQAAGLLTAVSSLDHDLRRAMSEGTNGGRAGSALLQTLGKRCC